jgi:hypothetical protein
MENQVTRLPIYQPSSGGRTKQFGEEIAPDRPKPQVLQELDACILEQHVIKQGHQVLLPKYFTKYSDLLPLPLNIKRLKFVSEYTELYR